MAFLKTYWKTNSYLLISSGILVLIYIIMSSFKGKLILAISGTGGIEGDNSEKYLYLFMGGIILFSLIYGLMAFLNRKIHFHLKYLHINLTLLSVIIVYIYVNWFGLGSVSHYYDPQEGLGQEIFMWFALRMGIFLNLSIFIFLFAQILFLINIIRAVNSSKQLKQIVEIQDIDHLVT